MRLPSCVRGTFAATSPRRAALCSVAPRRVETRSLEPAAAVLETGFHRVSAVHQLYYEVHGNPTGPPAVVLHGGPGAGCSAALGRLFDLSFWKVVLFDQRGCGKSGPRGLLYSNNTRKLVGDVEKLRYHLRIKKWLVFGGSHGSTLALLYAQQHASRVSGLVLRAVCLMRQSELDWLFSPTGAAVQIPKGWQRFLSILRPNERKNPIKAYYNRMLSVNRPVSTQAARYWREWTMTVMFSKLPQFDHDKIVVKPETLFDKPSVPPSPRGRECRLCRNTLEEIEPLPAPIVQSLIEAHFFYYNKQFIADLFPILDHIDWIRDIPCIAVHGEEDPICLPSTPLALKAAWEELDLRLIPNAGHSQFDPPIREATVQALEEMKAVAGQSVSRPAFHDVTPERTYPTPEPHYRKKYR